MKKLVTLNFYLSVAVCIVAGIGLFISPSILLPASTDASESSRNMVSMIGMAVAIVQVVFLMLSYRHQRGQIPALLIGAAAVIMGQYIGEHLGADLILGVSNLETLSNLGYYVGLSHLFYTVLSSPGVQELLTAIERVRQKR